jgi:hypothetical protein
MSAQRLSRPWPRPAVDSPPLRSCSAFLVRRFTGSWTTTGSLVPSVNECQHQVLRIRRLQMTLTRIGQDFSIESLLAGPVLYRDQVLDDQPLRARFIRSVVEVELAQLRNKICKWESYQLEAVQYDCASTGSGNSLNRFTMGHRIGCSKRKAGSASRGRIHTLSQ